jgi:hypothetical protein
MARSTAVKRTEAASARRAEAERRRLRRHAVEQVEAYLREQGFDNPADLRTRRGYSIEVDEMTVVVGFEPDGRDLVYLVGAEVMALPSDPDLVVPMLRELLELNAAARGPARLAVEGDAVWVVAVDLVALMPDADFGRCIDAVVAWASLASSLLRKKYQRTTRRRRGA